MELIQEVRDLESALEGLLLALLLDAGHDLLVHGLDDQGHADEYGDPVLRHVLLDVLETVAEAGVDALGEPHALAGTAEGVMER